MLFMSFLERYNPSALKSPKIITFCSKKEDRKKKLRFEQHVSTRIEHKYVLLTDKLGHKLLI